MSGPKSSRYRLTPEQRKALEEARRREIKRQKGLAALSHHEKTIRDTLKELDHFVEKATLLREREGNDLDFSSKLTAYCEKAESFIKAVTLDKDADLPTVEKALAEADDTIKLLKEEALALASLGGEVESALSHSLTAAVGDAAALSFATLAEEEKKAIVARRIELRRSLLRAERDERLPKPLLAEIREALIALSDTHDLKTFEALQYKPLVTKISTAIEAFSQYEEEYLALRREYEALCATVNLSPLPTDCNEEGVKLLRRYIQTLSYEIAYDDEESYIGDVLDTVMREMGYHVLADRTVDKKSGKRFSHELYSYRDGTVVNVTTAGDGRITMELGKPDRVDRLPSDTETEMLVHEMEAFCHDFAEIEERLRAYGVEVADRITMLPPTAEHAQIINVEEYAFRRESESDKKEAIAWQTRMNKRRKVFRHIKVE